MPTEHIDSPTVYCNSGTTDSGIRRVELVENVGCEVEFVRIDRSLWVELRERIKDVVLLHGSHMQNQAADEKCQTHDV